MHLAAAPPAAAAFGPRLRRYGAFDSGRIRGTAPGIGRFLT